MSGRPDDDWTKLKICAVGEEAVGKTSLIRRFVADTFDGEYMRTMGTLISKRTVEGEGPEGRPMTVDVVIWDIMGKRTFSDLLKGAYFREAKGVFAVCDITRRETLSALHGWFLKFRSEVGLAPAVVMANKVDLPGPARVTAEEIEKVGGTYGAPFFLTSAKTGDKVSLAFEELIRAILQRRARKRRETA